jgi:hypothetical protein
MISQTTAPPSGGVFVSPQSHTKLGGDAADGLYDAGNVNEQAIRQAALLTLRRANPRGVPAAIQGLPMNRNDARALLVRRLAWLRIRM